MTMPLPLKIIVKLLALAPAWLAVPLLIWWADPHGLLRPNNEDRARAERVARGEGILWSDAANHRGFVRELIPIMPRRDIVILGSSRVFRVHGEPFAPRSVMNLGITCATLEELRGIVELLRREGKLPEHLIVGVDPWTFNPQHLRRAPNRCLREAGAIEPISLRSECIRTVQTLISPAYFQLSLQSLRKEPVRSADLTSLPKTVAVRLADGSFRVPELFDVAGATAAERCDARVRQALHDRIWSEYAFTTGEEPLLQAFAEFMLSVPSASILIVPLHPDYYAVVQEEEACRRAFAMEAWLRSFGAEHSIPVIGSFDPARCGMSHEDFTDAHHASEAAMGRLAKELAVAIPAAH